MQELRDAFDKESPRLHLAVGLSGYPEIIETSYDLRAISPNVDFMTVMTYDYHGAWEGVTGHVSPLKGLSGDKLPKYNTVSFPSRISFLLFTKAFLVAIYQVNYSSRTLPFNR